MNYQTAAVVAAAAFLLSGLSGFLGGVPLLDILWRALLWAALGFGASLGIEVLLRKLLPDLFEPQEVASEDEPPPVRAVDITLDDDRPSVPSGIIEEADEEIPPLPFEDREPVVQAAAVAPSPAVTEPQGGDEAMPEIGSFLDAFKPGAPGEAAAPSAVSPEIGDYAPVEPEPRRSGAGAQDGDEQDPAILAKAIQTVMKRDTQGN